MRVNVWLPDELAATIRRRLPNVNLSNALQTRLRELLACRHERVVCSACAEPFDVHGHAQAHLDAFYVDLADRLYELVARGGTVEGAARVAKEVAVRWRVPSAATRTLPRMTRAERAAAHTVEMPETA